VKRHIARPFRLGCLLLLVVLAGGCRSVGYYAQAVKGHCQVVSRQDSCRKLIADTNTPPELRAQLELATELCHFAGHELDLPAGKAYRRYADLERPYVVWNVYAAPRLSLEPRTWWYPFVGSLDYRGYFNEDAARRYAATLAGNGADVYVEGVEAYSTLGWFNDPLLNTFLHHPEPILAEVLFHELAHRKVFAPGDTDFNEAFATVTARAGVRRWLQATGDAEALARYDAALDRNDAFVVLVQDARQRLQQLYERNPEVLAPDAAEKGKTRILEELRSRFNSLRLQSEGYDGYELWFAEDLNNAKLNSVATYYDLVPAFDRLLRRHNGDLEAFYDAVSNLRELRKSERHEKLQDETASLVQVR
jgi:predicted aminopeptidase